MQTEFNGIKFSDSDVINPEEFMPGKAGVNHSGSKPYLIHDQGVVLCVVFARSEQDAMDEAVDNDKLDRYQIKPEEEGDRNDYMTLERPADRAEPLPDFEIDGQDWYWQEGREPAYLGNASETFDLEGIQIVELPNPDFSFVAQFVAHMANHKPTVPADIAALLGKDDPTGDDR